MLELSQNFVTRNRTFSNPQRITPRGMMIHSVGTPQPRAAVFMQNINTSSAGVSYHGIIEGGGRAFQLLPWNFRAWHAGGAANNTHIAVEMTEPNTIRYTTGANFVDNNPTQTGAFVRDTYQTAVALFAKVCAEFNLNPLADGVIISHSEGHRRGIASNHGDVEHLWSRFGLTMSQFRRDIQAAMEKRPEEEIEKEETEEEEVVENRFNQLEDVPSWARPIVEKLQNTNAADGLPVLRGDGSGNLDLSLDMLRVIVIVERLLEIK